MTHTPKTLDADIVALQPDYLKRRQQELSLLQSALGRSDFEYILRLAHQWKGHAASFGFPEIGDLAQRLEMAARTGDRAWADALLSELAGHISKLSLYYGNLT